MKSIQLSGELWIQNIFLGETKKIFRKMNPTICLPPRIAGTPKATLEVRIDLLKSSATKTSSSNTETAKFIKLQWWGQTQDEAAKLSIECGAKITYNVLARPSHFQDYLRDAGRLYLETLSHTGKTLGEILIFQLLS